MPNMGFISVTVRRLLCGVDQLKTCTAMSGPHSHNHPPHLQKKDLALP
uniref:Uncharacterized protein n=1 Tax=Anguilla anguilla TaxID=7936 RepID=A0A0E9PF37_ANGAN